jgi:hypothetical protein
MNPFQIFLFLMVITGTWFWVSEVRAPLGHKLLVMAIAILVLRTLVFR